MDNFTMQFGAPTDEEDQELSASNYIRETVHGSYKAIVNRVYLGSFKNMDQALDVVNDYLNENEKK
jgi:hypothetical protein